MSLLRAFTRRWKIPSSWNPTFSFSLSTFTYTTTTGRQHVPKPCRPDPPPIRVEFTESAGRGVFATRTIRAGDLIHTAKPLVSYPYLSDTRSACYFCLRKMYNATSSQAWSDLFCSEECKEQAKAFYEVERRVDWSAFDNHCRSRGMKYPFLVKRFACMVVSGAASEDNLDILQPANLSHQMIVEIEEEFGLLKHAFVQANIMEAKVAFLTRQWYSGVLARIRINAFRIEPAGGLYEDLLQSASASIKSDIAVGNALYMLPSFYNHDCDPNAHIMWIENADALLKTLCDVEAGTELRICYIDGSMGRDARRELLSSGFGFRCQCLRCLSGD